MDSLCQVGRGQYGFGLQIPYPKAQLLGLNYFNYSHPIDKNEDGFTDLTMQTVFRFLTSLIMPISFHSPRVLFTRTDGGGQMNWLPIHRGGDNVYGESIYTSRFELFGKYQLNKNLTFQFSFNDHNQNLAMAIPYLMPIRP